MCACVMVCVCVLYLFPTILSLSACWCQVSTHPSHLHKTTMWPTLFNVHCGTSRRKVELNSVATLCRKMVLSWARLVHVSFCKCYFISCKNLTHPCWNSFALEKHSLAKSNKFFFPLLMNIQPKNMKWSLAK